MRPNVPKPPSSTSFPMIASTVLPVCRSAQSRRYSWRRNYRRSGLTMPRSTRIGMPGRNLPNRSLSPCRSRPHRNAPKLSQRGARRFYPPHTCGSSRLMRARSPKLPMVAGSGRLAAGRRGIDKSHRLHQRRLSGAANAQADDHFPRPLGEGPIAIRRIPVEQIHDLLFGSLPDS